MNSVFDAMADNLSERGYAIVDQFLSQAEVQAICRLEEFTATEHFKKAGIGKQQLQINESIRNDQIRWLDKQTAPPEIRAYLEKVDNLILYLNQALFLSLKDYEIHMTIYPVGAFYKRHLDQFRKDDHRKLSIICYLNENWEDEHGGQLRIYLPEGPLDVLPSGGRLVCFRSEQLEHEVLPAMRERLSLTGWILDQHSDLRHL